MPRGVHKNPFLGWNPPAEDSAWAREEADRRGVKLSTILTEALSEYRAKHSAKHPPAPAEPVSPPRRTRKPREDTAPAVTFTAPLDSPNARIALGADPDCPHPKARINKGLCGACGTYVGTKPGGK